MQEFYVFIPDILLEMFGSCWGRNIQQSGGRFCFPFVLIDKKFLVSGLNCYQISYEEKY